MNVDGSQPSEVSIRTRRFHEAVQFFIPRNANPPSSDVEWEDLSNRVASEEAKLAEIGIFNSVRLQIAEKVELIEPWANLIPDDYGLCVVKSLFAILLRSATQFKDDRDAITNAFLTIRTIIGNATIKIKQFRKDAEVGAHASSLRGAIMDAIPELTLLMQRKLGTTQGNFNFLGHKGKESSKDTQAILGKLTFKANQLRQAVDACRDATIIRTEEEIRKISDSVGWVRWNCVEIKTIMMRFDAKQQKQQFILESMNDRIEEGLSRFDGLFQRQTEIETSTRQALAVLRSLQDDRIKPARQTISKAVISPGQLFDLLTTNVNGTKSSEGREKTYFDFKALTLQYLNIVQRTTICISPSSLHQAHSILKQHRFFRWLHRDIADMLIVDCNIKEDGLKNVSTMSLFCANFGLTMANLEPHSIITQYYCGLHAVSDPKQDPWHGPEGMLRYLTTHLFLVLTERKSLNLEFLNSKSYVQRLKNHELNSLSSLLLEFLQHFDPETTIYFIIDNMSRYETDFNNGFLELRAVLLGLQRIIQHDGLKPRLKILITVPYTSSKRLRDLTDETFHLALPALALAGHGISEASIYSSILNPKTATSLNHDEEEEATEWGGPDDDDE